MGDDGGNPFSNRLIGTPYALKYERSNRNTVAFSSGILTLQTSLKSSGFSEFKSLSLRPFTPLAIKLGANSFKSREASNLFTSFSVT